MITETIIANTKQMIDDLKTVCANFGLGNASSEYKIITEIFLYKFLNDKFLYEVQQADERLKNAGNVEQALNDMPEDDYEMLIMLLPAATAKLKREHFISYLFNHKNDYLEQQMMTIFRFNFLQNVQSDWQRLSLAILSEMYQPKTISGKELVENGKYYVYGANGIIGKYNQYNHPDAEIAVACRGASCGSIQMTLPFSWITGNAMVIKPTSDFPYKEYLYYYLLAKSPNYLCSGSAQPQLTRENLSLYTITVPSKQQTDDFEEKAKRSRILIINNQLENNRLISLRDWLLPMLMNGQATIED